MSDFIHLFQTARIISELHDELLASVFFSTPQFMSHLMDVAAASPFVLPADKL